MSLSAGQQRRCRQREQTVDTVRKERAGRGEGAALKHMHHYTWDRWPVGTGCLTQGAQTGAPWQSRGVGRGRGEGGPGGRRHTCVLRSPSRGLQPARLLCPRDSPDKGTGVGSHALLQRIFPTQGSDSGLPPCRWILYHLSHQGSPGILERVAYLFSRGSFQCRNWTGVFFIAGRLFTSWATRETQTYVYLWLIHVDVWQKTIQYYKTIIF